MSKSKVAIITGASSGIGRATAVALSAAGFSVTISARREIELKETAQQCKGEVLSIIGDVTKEEDVKRLFEQTIAKFGRLDLLFNNAGITGPNSPIESTPLGGFQDTLAVNLTAAFLCTREAIRVFKSQAPQGGRIINNASLAAHIPRPHSVAYACSKHAIAGLSKATALEGRSFGISCTQLDIGNAATAMARGHTQGALQPDGSIRPEPNFDSQHVANAIIHIASLPHDVTVLEMNIMATGMPYVGRG